MTVYVKPNSGRVYCIYRGEDGRHVWEPFGKGSKAKKAAGERDLEIKLQKARGTFSSEAWRPKIFSEIAQDYINARQLELSDDTRDAILRCVTTYALPVIGTKIISSITLNDWQKIQQSMIRKGLSPVTINTYFKYISYIFTWALDQHTGLLREHPWRKRKPLRVKNPFKVDLLTIKEFILIRDNASEHLAWCMEVAYHTGARVGPKELFSLKWSDVDFRKASVKIDGKGGGRRTQYVSPEFVEKMVEHYDAQEKKYPGCQWVCSYRGARIKSIKHAWATALKEAGITRRVRPYDIRHLHITYALAMGADIEALAQRVGHKTTRMIVNVYSHLAKDLVGERAFVLPDISKPHPE